MDVDDQLVVVTGACGGMGAAIARSFASEGRALVLSDLFPEPLAALATELQHDAPAETVAGDITAPDYPESIIAALRGRSIGSLVHTAGVSPTMAAGRRIFDINFSATRHLVEMLLPHMAPGSAIILIASNSGQIMSSPFIDRALKTYMRRGRSFLINRLIGNSRMGYALSKRAVQLYVQVMAKTCGEKGVRIVSVSPGIIDTNMGRREFDAGPEMGKMIAITPLKRMGIPEEIATTVTFLASPAASYISGTDFLVDGGVVAAIDQAGGALRALR